MVEYLDHDTRKREREQDDHDDIEHGNEVGRIGIAEEHFGQESDTDDAERAHSRKEDRAEHIERHTDAVEHDQTRKGNDERGNFFVMFGKVLRLKVGKNARTLNGKDEDDGAREGP